MLLWAVGRGQAVVAGRRALTREATPKWLNISEEVQQALVEDQAVVALESTIISHGMPYPTNLEVAHAVEQDIRQNGAVPATIALARGQVHVGLSKALLEELADPNAKVQKTSRRDLAQVLSQGQLGSTTVAGTMIAAHAAGIDVFATGGIGGVHRDGENTMDVSADLTELGRTPVAVICAGVKSILDIPHVDAAIEAGLAAAKASNVMGKDVTPFLLSYVNQATAGRSLQANIALVRNNAATAARIAVAARMPGSRRDMSTHAGLGRAYVLGGATEDVLCRTDRRAEASYNTSRHFTWYGIACVSCAWIRDVSLAQVLPASRTATYAAFLERGALVSAIADMDVMQQLLRFQQFPKLETQDIILLDANGLGDHLDATVRGPLEAWLAQHRVWLEPTSTVRAIEAGRLTTRIPIWAISPDFQEFGVLLEQLSRSAAHDYAALDPADTESTLDFVQTRWTRLFADHTPHGRAPLLFLKRGAQGLIAPDVATLQAWADPSRTTSPTTPHVYQHFCPEPVTQIVNVTGAGDSMVAAILAMLLARRYDSAVAVGLRAARLSLAFTGAINPASSQLRDCVVHGAGLSDQPVL
ncbi:uncharacterized protein MONBRDRAFT_27110 [Monosiga brevicollis MX1]|uniref:Carbohydrate kinase PfkB domain-containing protein n=1 Tax=Monosiga brevicollis TaxID=81824 RepID=A9V4B8_MONBE|nr:uncharacterized protein MONBRDRAFT_27110 [Monosiga brevicollis MX1]EDQ87683.1 predicted protein [Monosiga brevicollis MX1]|eukprot:XP_001747603.1 hypothetical protein [Monosiga brevicollis MX1]